MNEENANTISQNATPAPAPAEPAPAPEAPVAPAPVEATPVAPAPAPEAPAELAPAPAAPVAAPVEPAPAAPAPVEATPAPAPVAPAPEPVPVQPVAPVTPAAPVTPIPAQPAGGVPVFAPEQPPKKKSNLPFIIIVIVLLLAIVGLVVAFVLNNNKKDDNKKDDTKVTEKKKEEEKPDEPEQPTQPDQPTDPNPVSSANSYEVAGYKLVLPNGYEGKAGGEGVLDFQNQSIPTTGRILLAPYNEYSEFYAIKEQFKTELEKQGMTVTGQAEKNIGNAKWYVTEATYQGVYVTYSFSNFKGGTVLLYVMTKTSDYSSVYSDMNTVFANATAGSTSFAKNDKKASVPGVDKSISLK